jgi:hypothetical protein
MNKRSKSWKRDDEFLSTTHLRIPLRKENNGSSTISTSLQSNYQKHSERNKYSNLV